MRSAAETQVPPNLCTSHWGPLGKGVDEDGTATADGGANPGEDFISCFDASNALQAEARRFEFESGEAGRLSIPA